jgi:hypothetical protein
MQSYFNHDDANIELDAVLNGNPTQKYLAADFDMDESNRWVKFLILASLLVTFVFTLQMNLTSAIPRFKLPDDKLEVVNKFIVELPEKEKPKIEKIARQKEIPKPKDRKPPVRRKMPEAYVSRTKPIVEQNRDIKDDQVREQVTEKAAVREMPAVQTPVIEKSDLVMRENAAQQIRLVSAAISSDTVRQYSYEGIEVRDAPTTEVSHSQLDPYHYQMVDLCLRLCAQSIFLREGGGIPQQKFSYDWLKIRKGPDQDIMYFKHKGAWFEFTINTDKLKDLSDLSFVEIPVDYETQVGSVEVLFEDITRKLCKILKHDDCLGSF